MRARSFRSVVVEGILIQMLTAIRPRACIGMSNNVYYSASPVAGHPFLAAIRHFHEAFQSTLVVIPTHLSPTRPMFYNDVDP